MFFNIKTLTNVGPYLTSPWKHFEILFPCKKWGWGGLKPSQYTFPVFVSATKGIVPCFCSICALSLLLNASYFLYNEAVLNVV